MRVLNFHTVDDMVDYLADGPKAHELVYIPNGELGDPPVEYCFLAAFLTDGPFAGSLVKNPEQIPVADTRAAGAIRVLDFWNA